MERHYRAWEASFEDKKKRGARRPKVVGGSDVEAPKRLDFLAREEPHRLNLELVDPAPPDNYPFEGFLADAPHDSTFVVVGESVDIDRMEAMTPDEIMLTAGLGPPRKPWRAKIVWSAEEGTWRVA